MWFPHCHRRHPKGTVFEGVGVQGHMWAAALPSAPVAPRGPTPWSPTGTHGPPDGRAARPTAPPPHAPGLQRGHQGPARALSPSFACHQCPPAAGHWECVSRPSGLCVPDICGALPRSLRASWLRVVTAGHGGCSPGAVGNAPDSFRVQANSMYVIADPSKVDRNSAMLPPSGAMRMR